LGEDQRNVERTWTSGAGVNEGIRFEVGDITMEFSVEIRKDSRAKLGFTAWVITAGAEGGIARSDVHKVTLSLRPRQANGEPVEVSDDTRGGTELFDRRSGS
jgi:Trypsin-co-occurring domain 2